MLNFFLHIREFKLKVYYIIFCLFNTYIFCYLFMSQLINILSLPLCLFINHNNFDFVFSSIFDIFNSFILLSGYTAFFFCFPVISYFVISFLKSGLYYYEKLFFYSFFNITFRLMLLSFFLCYFFLIPCTLSFLFGLGIIHDTNFIVLKSNISLYHYSIFVYKFVFIYSYGIFQIPIVISLCTFFLKPIPLSLFKLRKLSLLSSFFFGFVLSSSDYFSFVFISAIIFLFFEIFTFLRVLKIRYLSLF